ncbi:MAG: hypothetical protein JWR40_2976, partial [Massilia sp.]|nr:hypothetical protein [Massilia sp.]
SPTITKLAQKQAQARPPAAPNKD